MAGVKGRSGGKRSGSGRKAASVRMRVVRGTDDRGEARPVTLPAGPVACPEGVPPAVAAVWAELAPSATQMGTLAPTTASAFLRLCQAVVKHGQMERQIEQDGLTYLKVTIDGAGSEHTEVKAHPLISRAHALDNAIRGWFKDFAINPFGKPLVAQDAVKDDFDEFDAGPQLVNRA